MFSTLPSLFAYTDYDSTVILKDSGNTLLASIMGEEELDRIDRLPETDPANVSLRQAEDMKWAHVNMTVDDAADLLVYGSSPSSSAPAIQPVEIDPGFSAFHEFCKTNLIPMVIISM
ncbi:hypothetical protein BGZ83_012150 [Gryganskiella cystojenkinii]|nr:hypothetical protein BGZ83_012150 [Gryganskiella cystojenkinii]